MKKNYTLCEGGPCELKETCARYLPDLDKTKVTHFGPIPWNQDRKKCNFYEHFNPLEDLNELNIISSGG